MIPKFMLLFFPGRPMPDIETLMQEWSPEFEELLGKVRCPSGEPFPQRATETSREAGPRSAVSSVPAAPAGLLLRTCLLRGDGEQPDARIRGRCPQAGAGALLMAPSAPGQPPERGDELRPGRVRRHGLR